MDLPPNTGTARGRGRGKKPDENANRGMAPKLVSLFYLKYLFGKLHMQSVNLL